MVNGADTVSRISELTRIIERGDLRKIKVIISGQAEKEELLRTLPWDAIYVSSLEVRKGRGSNINKSSSIRTPQRFITNLLTAINQLSYEGILVVNPPGTMIDPEDESRARELIDKAISLKSARVIILEERRAPFSSHFTVQFPQPDLTAMRELFNFIHDWELRNILADRVRTLSYDEAKAVASRVKLLPEDSTAGEIINCVYDAKGEILSQAPGISYLGVRREVAAGYTDLVLQINEILPDNYHLNLMISGVPGTGKTLFARYISNFFALPLYQFNPAELRNSYFGKTEERAKAAVSALKKAGPAVILIDEYEKLTTVPQNSSMADVLLAVRTEILKLLEDESRNSIIVATSNHPNLISPEELRRFRLRLFFDLPSGDRGFQILAHYLSDANLLSAQERSWVERKLHRLFSGSLIKEVAEEAVRGRDDVFNSIRQAIERKIDEAVSLRIKNEELIKNHMAGGFIRI